MLITIISKELRNNLTSLRFFLTLLLTVIITIISTFIFTDHYRQRMDEFRELQINNDEELSNNASNLSRVAFQSQTIQLKPTPMELVADGGIKNLPKTFRVSAFQISEPENISRSNKFIYKFANVDWTFMIAFILSFFAILLTFDAVSGEKNDGTLRLTLSHAVNRSSVMLGKYLNALVTLAIPLLLGVMLSLLIITGYGQVPFSALQPGKILLYLIAALFYLSIFVLFGLLITGLTHNSITSIIILLFIWVFLALLIPNSGGKIAVKFFPIPTRELVDRQISDKRSEIAEAHRARYDKTFNWDGNIWAEFVPYRCRAVTEMADARNRINHDYLSRRIKQIQNAKSVLIISPTVVFSNIADQICMTGLDHFEYFYQQIFDYRNQFRQFIIEKDKADPDSPHQVYEWENTPMSQKPVPPNSIPRFQERKLSFVKTIQKALFNFAILLVFNLILFIAVYTVFQRYDVR